MQPLHHAKPLQQAEAAERAVALLHEALALLAANGLNAGVGNEHASPTARAAPVPVRTAPVPVPAAASGAQLARVCSRVGSSLPVQLRSKNGPKGEAREGEASTETLDIEVEVMGDEGSDGAAALTARVV